MTDIKMSLTIELPGSTMVSKEASLAYATRPVYKNGKKVYKNGKPIFEKFEVEDPSKHDLNTLLLTNNKGKVVDRISFYTRRCIPAKKVTHICKEAYLYMISTECPPQFRGPKRQWLKMKETDRLLWHLDNYAQAFGGKVIDFVIYDD